MVSLYHKNAIILPINPQLTSKLKSSTD